MRRGLKAAALTTLMGSSSGFGTMRPAAMTRTLMKRESTPLAQKESPSQLIEKQSVDFNSPNNVKSTNNVDPINNIVEDVNNSKKPGFNITGAGATGTIIGAAALAASQREQFPEGEGESESAEGEGEGEGESAEGEGESESESESAQGESADNSLYNKSTKISSWNPLNFISDYFKKLNEDHIKLKEKIKSTEDEIKVLAEEYIELEKEMQNENPKDLKFAKSELNKLGKEFASLKKIEPKQSWWRGFTVYARQKINARDKQQKKNCQ